MRLFVASDISDKTREQIRAIRERLIPELEASRRAPRVTWVKDEGAHVTLRFIGEVPEDAAEAVATALNARFELEPFEVSWDRLGTFPAGRSPRVIWIGASHGTDAFVKLAHLVNTRLEGLLGPGEARPFTPHLTVARVKEPGKSVPWPELLTRVRIKPTVTRVDHVTLYRSRLSPKGATYTEVLRTPLA